MSKVVENLEKLALNETFDKWFTFGSLTTIMGGMIFLIVVDIYVQGGIL